VLDNEGFEIFGPDAVRVIEHDGNKPPPGDEVPNLPLREMQKLGGFRHGIKVLGVGLT